MVLLSCCRVLITGSNGFIGSNLSSRLNELSGVTVTHFTRDVDPDSLPRLISNVDIVVHLAGENRPLDESSFVKSNTRLTEILCSTIENEFNKNGRKVGLIFASSVQAKLKNPYGSSKLAAETAVRRLADDIGNAVALYRLPGVFGKWCRPNYNSVVATFCHNIARNLPIQINDETTTLNLVYIDDVVNSFIDFILAPKPGLFERSVAPEYSISIRELADQIRAFERCRDVLLTERVGSGFVRALYATYVSYLPVSRFSYELPRHSDPRGIFVEFLKTSDSGQFSFFTAHPGITRGGHYHHTKSEKFLVIKGEALFRFRHIVTGELVELRTTGEKSEVVDTIPGWSHDITNVGKNEMLVMLWANENFDREHPDTITSTV